MTPSGYITGILLIAGVVLQMRSIGVNPDLDGRAERVIGGAIFSRDVVQHRPEFVQGPGTQALHVARRAAEDGRHLIHTQVGPVPQHHDGAALGREGAQRVEYDYPVSATGEWISRSGSLLVRSLHCA